MKKINLLLVMLLVIGIFATVAVGCDDKNKNDADYTIIVNGLDGKPSEGVSLQVCKVSTDGSLGTCYTFSKTTDKDGKVTLNIEKDGMDAENDWIEVHLQGLPPYQSYTDSRMHKGETKTINIIESIATPTGTGTAQYKSEQPDVLDTEANFDPYHMEYSIVHSGAAYGIKFDKADQKIYIEYYTMLEYDYKIYSISDVELKLTELCFDEENITNTHEDQYVKTGTKLDHIFTTDHEKGDGYVTYFELELVNAEDVGKEIKLCFEISR